MACNSCGRSGPIKVERVSSSVRGSVPKPAIKRLHAGRIDKRSTAPQPANNLDKHRA